MSTDSAIIDLKHILPEKSWHWVIPALMSEGLIWESLQNPDFRGLAVTRIGSQPESWTPAHLALLTLPGKLTPTKKIPPEIHMQASEAFQQHSETRPIQDLKQAALLALALREQQASENPSKISINDSWQAALTCLFGMLTDPTRLLRELPPKVAVQTFIANPLTPDKQIQILGTWLSGTPTKARLSVLRELATHRPQLAADTARQWLVHQEIESATPGIASHPQPSMVGTHQVINELARLGEIGETFSIAQENEDTIQVLRQISELAGCLHSDTQTLAAKIAIESQVLEEVAADFTSNGKLNPVNAATLSLAFLDAGQPVKAQEILAHCQESPNGRALKSLAQALLAYQNGDRETARTEAIQALEGFENQADYTIADLRKLVTLLLGLNYSFESLRAINLAERAKFQDPEIIHLSAKAQAANGNSAEAAQAAHLAVAISPNHLMYRRTLAEILEGTGQWLAALEQRDEILKKQPSPDISDLRTLAVCAFQNGKLERAAEVCQQALEYDPDDGLIHSIYGRTFAALDDLQRADLHLQKAIRLAPEQADPWLALAETQRNSGKIEDAKESLMKASNAVPDHPKIYLALGEAYLDIQADTQALTALRRADELIKAAPNYLDRETPRRISLKLGQTLDQLGHYEEACQVVEKSWRSDRRQTELSRLYAKILLSLNRISEALPILSQELEEHPEDAELQLDYARAYLEVGREPRKVIPILKGFLKNSPEDTEGQILLAEALSASDEPSEALKIYRLAFSRGSQTDQAWHTRLCLGLGRTAIQLDQPETALAALQQAWQSDPENPKIAFALASAYQCAALPEKALKMAKTALDLSPDDIDTLTWFADLVFQLAEPEQAIAALKKAIEIKPDNCKLRLQLADLYAGLEDRQAAHQSYSQVLEMEGAEPDEVLLAARGLNEIGDSSEAIEGFERALLRYQTMPGEHPNEMENILASLVDLYVQAGKTEIAVDRIDQAIGLSPDNLDLLAQKTDLLLQIGDTDGALAHTQKTLTRWPEQPRFLFQAAKIYRSLGNMAAALDHALQSVSASQPPTLPILAMAAELSLAVLQFDRARELLALGQTIWEQESEDDNFLPDLRPEYLDFFCLQAELSLQADEEIAAAEALTSALQVNSNHPHTLALQARLTARQGDLNCGTHILQTSLKNLGDSPELLKSSLISQLALAQAALEFRQWSTAIYLLQEATQTANHEPLTHLAFARALVLRAEYQRICQDADVTRHAPGSSVLADFACQSFEEAISDAARLMESIEQSSKRTSIRGTSPISIWMARGQAIFRPSLEHAHALTELPPSPENMAAFIATLRYAGDLPSAVKAANDLIRTQGKELPAHPGLLGQLGLAIASSDSVLALKMAAAAEKAARKHALADQAIFNALKAKIAQSVGDSEMQFAALQTAINLWNDEAKWHAQAAILLRDMDIEDANQRAIEHFEQAARLAPHEVKHYIQLGEAYLQCGNVKAALQSLEQATRLHVDQIEPWLSLAKAYQSSGNLTQTTACAEHAIEIDPNNPAPYLILGQVALNNDNPQNALEYCAKVLQAQPDDPQGLLLQSQTLAILNQPVEALASLEKALPQVPSSIPLMLEHVRLIQRAQGEDAALKKLQQLANETPDDPAILAAYAEALASANQYKAAIKAAQKALQYSQEDFDAVEEVQLLQLLGNLLRRNGQLDQAIQHFNQAIERQPQNIEPYLELGRIYHSRRQYEQSLEILQQAIEIAPDDYRPFFEAGQTLNKAKDYANAERVLRKAAKLAPQNVSIQRQLGAMVVLNLVHNRKKNPEFAIPVDIEQ
jgi:tetratricopeptide (TPR) repeat protein